MNLSSSTIKFDDCNAARAHIAPPEVPAPPPPTPQKPPVMRRHRVSARHRAPTRMAREKLLEQVLSCAREKRFAAVDARRAARVIAKRKDLFDVEDIDEPVELSDDQINALLAEIEAEVEADRREAEQSALERYEREQLGEIEELLAFQSLSIDDHFVKCPACATGGLLVRHGVVVCSCGLRVNCGAVENVTPDIVRQRLADVHTAHERCGGILKFEAKCILDNQFLHAQCLGCGAEEIVL